MARYTGPVCRLCRREGKKLFLKGERCYSEKCSIGRREYAPGQHGQGRKKISEYGMQLRAKQTARRYYGVNEVQFRHYFEIAERKAGVTGENLLKILESRLDNIVYRAGFAASRAEARILVNHGHFTVNGKRVNIPSYLVKAGEVIAICDKSRQTDKFKAIVEANSGRPVPVWMSKDLDKCSVVVNNIPNRDEIDAPVDEQPIVEFYSR